MDTLTSEMPALGYCCIYSTNSHELFFYWGGLPPSWQPKCASVPPTIQTPPMKMLAETAPALQTPSRSCRPCTVVFGDSRNDDGCSSRNASGFPVGLEHQRPPLASDHSPAAHLPIPYGCGPHIYISMMLWDGNNSKRKRPSRTDAARPLPQVGTVHVCTRT
jgi:hypothetical protein